MVNHLETCFVACCAYFTAKLHQFKKKKTLGQFENLVFVIMSTKENIRLFARSSLWRMTIYNVNADLVYDSWYTKISLNKSIRSQDNMN